MARSGHEISKTMTRSSLSTGERRPNVLLLTADTLRADRLGLYGYDRPTTPYLDRFAESAIVCNNAYTLGPFTQVACIQLFTSSRPLSYGGYDRGAEGRPETLFKRFRDAGYSTWGLSTIHWVSSYYGYTDGMDEEIGVFHLNTLVGMAVTNMRDTLSAYNQGIIPADKMLATAMPVIRHLFENVDDYCDTLSEREDEYRRDFSDSKIVNDDYDFRRVKRVVDSHRRAFEFNPVEYVHRHLKQTPQAHEWLARDWRYCRKPRKLIRESLLRATNGVIRFVDPARAGRRETRYRQAVDAHAIASKVIGQLRSADPGKPFFIWAHFKDTHQPFVSGTGRNWVPQTKKYLQQLGYDDNIDPTMVFRGRPKTGKAWTDVSALYDAAVRSTDAAVGKILDAVDDLGLTDDMLIGFCGDHGEEIGEHGDYGHQCMHYEHNSRVPMMFRAGRGQGQRIDSLVTSLDWAPTLAHMAGIGAAPGWEGAPVTDGVVAERDHIVMETFCRGNCAFEHRPVYFGVRTRSHKYLLHEYQDPTHTYGTPDPALYDLTADPQEQDNLYKPDHPVVLELNRIIAERLAEIPDILPERWRRLLVTDPTDQGHGKRPAGGNIT
jgi:arylsulfatase A-like enzyme